eukprot:CAMPEP_0201242694 /NCGR_PEP_ID=MMETSP0852-20130820/38809_1 /ASSEMBLY_ACC=CAM_ASM_000632 /TAXON_ID=183588 /ORGANISM="Pseudo-nitzschia fraudulenta, Strain WWA7" /LENGTH=78 /DNA_ID=CAMNT_0047539461 /DNA_START=359 /DNA_END=591 /DNA_ORIENTATION=+
MGKEKEREQKQPSPMKPSRPSEILRHGFGSPEGIEMPDIPATKLDPAASQQKQYPSQTHDPKDSSSTSLLIQEVGSTT